MAELNILFGVDASNPDMGTYNGWNTVAVTTNEQTRQEAIARDNLGNIAASNAYGDQNNYSVDFECVNDTNTVPAEIGAVVGASNAVCTTITISTNCDQYAKMTLGGHQHTSNPHEDLRSVAHGVTVPNCFGPVNFTSATIGSAAYLESASVTISVQHIDENCGTEHKVGQNHGPKIEANMTFVGEPDTFADNSWTILSVPLGVSANDSFQRFNVQAHKYLTIAE
jgi:hypothetical protein